MTTPPKGAKRRLITNNPFANAAPVRAPEYTEHVPGQTGIPLEGAPPAGAPPSPASETDDDARAEACRRAQERKQLPGVPAPAPKTNGRRTRVAGGRLKKPVPQTDLFVTMPWNMHAGMKDLASKKGATLKDEVLAAFALHFEANGYTPPPED